MRWTPGQAEEIAPASKGGEVLRHRYRVLRRLLAANSQMLERMADLEADLAFLDPGEQTIGQRVLQLLDGTLLLSENLNILTDGAHRALYAAHAEIEQAVRGALRSFPDPIAMPLVLGLEEASTERGREVGGKAANLGRLRTLVAGAVPNGFVITTAAYRLFLAENQLLEPIRKLFKDLSLITGRRLFAERTAAIRRLVLGSPVPSRVVDAIAAGLRSVGAPLGTRWAVRSSAVGEDGRMSFAGQFDTVLEVPEDGLASAYRTVLASRYNDHAVLYRLAIGLVEVDTPMAALFMPMVDARAAGVLYTRDPRDASADHMLIDAAAGLADAMVRGDEAAATVLARRSNPGAVEGSGALPAGFPLSTEEVGKLVDLGLRIEKHWGRPLDVEWVVARDGTAKIVQCRPLLVVEDAGQGGSEASSREPVASGGMTVFPGRAVGPAYVARSVDELVSAPEGAVLIVRQAGPELAAALPRLAGLVAEQGNPAGHAAALTREFAVPTLYGLADAERLLGGCETLSLDATQRMVFEGAIWPEVRERVRSRIRHVPTLRRANPLRERILALNLTNPLARDFRASGCRSVHDVVRYTHEKAVAAMFALGDALGRKGQTSVCRLESDLPLQLAVLDLGGCVPAAAHERRAVRAEEIASVPFQALWRGMTRPGVSWAGRVHVGVSGFMSVLASSLSESGGAREVGADNYLMVAPDYVNFNARLAYHFAMADAFVSVAPENNFVNFRFRGGGASPERRALRARFLAEVLLRSGFGVDRRGDLVTAWLRRHPPSTSEDGLATLGALMGCARQLDMLMQDEATLRHYVEQFLARRYAAFN